MERCSKCNKKSICLFGCTCKKLFCTAHRMPEDHACVFDHKKAFKELLTLRNPKVVTEKVDKI